MPVLNVEQVLLLLNSFNPLSLLFDFYDEAQYSQLCYSQ